MKGIILHGGAGTKLRPLTFTGPKQLIPIANKPISQYVLEDLVEAGIKEVAIVLGNIYPEKVKEYYKDGSAFNSEITYISQGEPKGIAHAVKLCEDFVGNESFVVYLGDNLIKGGITTFIERFEKNRKLEALILLTKVNQPSRFGVAKFDSSGKLVKLVEKPQEPPSNFALAGIYFLSPVVFEIISNLKPSWRGELEITDAIQALLERGYNVAHDFITGWWKDTGMPEDIIEANRLVLDELKVKVAGNVEDEESIEGRVSLGQGSLVKRGAKIRGPVVIGQDTVIESGVYIGPYTSIGNGCVIKRGEVEDSIIMEHCLIDMDERIVGSLIGPGSQLISNPNNRPSGRNFIVGESSIIAL